MMRSRLPEMAVSAFGNYAEALNSRRYERAKRQGGKKARVGLRHLEKVLVIGIWLYKSVRGIEHNWRTEVLERKTPYDPNEEAAIRDLIRQWIIPCPQCLKDIKFFESQGFKVAGGKQFEKYYLAACEILAGHNVFFDDDEKAIQWTSVTAQFRQNPRPVRVDNAGRIFESTGEPFTMPGLSPEDVLKGISEDERGRTRSLKSITNSINEHEL